MEMVAIQYNSWHSEDKAEELEEELQRILQDADRGHIVSGVVLDNTVETGLQYVADIDIIQVDRIELDDVDVRVEREEHTRSNPSARILGLAAREVFREFHDRDSLGMHTESPRETSNDAEERLDINVKSILSSVFKEETCKQLENTGVINRFSDNIELLSPFVTLVKGAISAQIDKARWKRRVSRSFE